VRATSTVLDAALFLLLVGGAVLTLSLPADPVPDRDGVDETADVLATSTADIEYTLAPGARRANQSIVGFPNQSGPAFQRRAHGTLVDHLATAAVGNVTVDGQQVSHTWDDYERATASATRNATRHRDEQAQVIALWRPYRNASIRGRLVVGPTPPPDEPVHVATMTVASDMPTTRTRAIAAAENGSFRAVAAVVANGTVRGLFPPRATTLVLRGDYPVDSLVAYRYRRLARLTDTSVESAVRDTNATVANRRLASALTARFATDMNRTFDSPTGAARTVSVDEVTIVVRTWSP
jgi:hypothetical protein